MERLQKVAGHLRPDANMARSAESKTTSSGECTRQRAVIVTGARTPFLKSFGLVRSKTSIDLGAAAVKGLLEKTKLDPTLVDEIIMGNVVVSTAAPNLAREIVIDLELPRTIPGTTVSIACLSGLEAVSQGVLRVEHGDADVVIAGGSDALSAGELPMPKSFTRALGKYQMGGGNKKGWGGIRELLAEAGPPTSWVPKPNSIAERSTGKTMGYHADLMADINEIPRAEQDKFAADSHRKAYEAQKSGLLDDEVVAVKTDSGKFVSKDNLVRSSLDPEKVSKLKPAFRPTGTITAASSSALTDGASAVLIMSESKAAKLGYATDIVMRSYSKTAIDPHPQLLMAPAIAINRALKRAGLSLDDIDIFEIHEAFAAQVLATLKVLESPEFAKKVPGGAVALGKVPLEKLNPNGGSLAIGHPFAATGGRLVASASNQLRRTGKRFALISICAAGGIGGVMILENTAATS